MIAITVEMGRLPAQLRNVERAIADQWWPEFSKQAMSVLAKEQSRHFTSQTGPGGEAWPALSALTLALSASAASQKVGGATRFTRTKGGALKAMRGGKSARAAFGLTAAGTASAVVQRTGRSKPMMNTGRLRASLMAAAGGSGAIRRTGKNWLEFGTNALPGKALRALQFGAKYPVTMKQRAYLSALLGHWFTAKQIKIPARPFIGVSARCRRELEAGSVAVANRLLRAATR